MKFDATQTRVHNRNGDIEDLCNRKIHIENKILIILALTW